MRRTSIVSPGLALALLLIPAKPVLADPIGITIGFVAISGEQDFTSRGFLRSIGYDFQVGGLRLADSDGDYLTQDVFAPKFPSPLWWSSGDGGGEVAWYGRHQPLTFRSTPGPRPSEFTMTGRLTLFNLANVLLLDQAVTGYGMATWEFVTTPEGNPLVSGVTYRFTPVPEPTGLLLLGSGLAALGMRRWRGRGAGRSVP